MSTFLGIIGVATILSGIVMGFLSGSFWGFIIAIVASILSATIFFALSRILENQEIIMSQISDIKQNTKKLLKTITCEFCSKTYTEDYSYCPHCGRKPTPTK